MIILDFGSGNTCRNDQNIITKMINELAEIDKKRKCIIKWQLFQNEGKNIPLSFLKFKFAYKYAAKLGFKTTASVFDLENLNLLLQYFKEEISFIKIANRPDLYWLINEIPRKIKVIISHSSLYIPNKKDFNIEYLCCISKYSATMEEYEQIHDIKYLKKGISDHTINWDLYNKYKPKIYECHYKLKDSIGLDAGKFAKTSKQLKEIL